MAGIEDLHFMGSWSYYVRDTGGSHAPTLLRGPSRVTVAAVKGLSSE